MKKTILITGSTDGIGKLVASRLASEGHRILVHGRNRDKVASVIKEISKNTSDSELKGYVADFSDLASVKQLAAEISDDFENLDIIINNAGIFAIPNPITDSGLDIRFAVNYLAPYVLTTRLLPILLKSKNPRVVNLSSAAQASVSIQALEGKMQLSASDAYAQSKLALTMWSFDFARQHPTINTIAVNPGSLLNTKMANEAYGQHWSPATKGSDILYELAMSAKHDDNSGRYFDNDQGSYGRAHSDAYNSGKIKALIEHTNQLIER